MTRERSNSDLVIVAGARSPFVRVGGAFADLSCGELGRLVLMHLLQGREDFRTGTELLGLGLDRADNSAIDPARKLALRAGLAESTPGATLAIGATSGLSVAARLIERRDLGGSGLFVLGGIGSASKALGIGPEDDTKRRRQLSTAAAGLLDTHQGQSLARQADRLAAELGISRRDQDESAFMSRRRARMNTMTRRADVASVVTSTEVITDDRGAGENEDLDWLGRLKALCGEGGTVTAGNSQILADGAAMLLLARERALPPGLEARARLVGAATWAGSPRHPGPAALGAIQRLLVAADLTLADLDLIEIHETFAADLLALRAIAASTRLWRRFGFEGEAPGTIEHETLNVAGSAVAIGQVGGAGGLRMLLSLTGELERRSLRRGAVVMAAGGGQAEAILIERD